MSWRLKFYILFSFFLFYLFGCGMQAHKGSGASFVDISPIEAKEKIKAKKNVLILDVRTPEEFSQGHIEGAINIPVQEIEKMIGELNKYKKYEIIVYCRSGSRSRKASEILIKHGFRNVYNLKGGFIEWNKTIREGKDEKDYERYNH